MQAGMAGEIARDEHGPRHEWPDHRVDLLKYRVERQHDLKTQTVELDMVHGRQKARLAEGVGPSAVVLPAQSVIEVVQRQVLEGGSRLGVEDVHQRAIGQLRQRNFRNLEPEPSGGLERAMVDFGRTLTESFR